MFGTLINIQEYVVLHRMARIHGREKDAYSMALVDTFGRSAAGIINLLYTPNTLINYDPDSNIQSCFIIVTLLT